MSDDHGNFVAITNTPGYLPDSDPMYFDEVEEAWSYLLTQRQEYEEQQTGYEEMSDYTDAVCVLGFLAREDIPGSKRERLMPAEAHDGQVIHYSISRDFSGYVTLATSLTHHEDNSLPEVFTVARITAEEES